MNDCNEWKTKKCFERLNLGKIQMTRIMMATVHHVTFGSGLTTISGCSIFVGQSVHCNFQEHNPNIKGGATLMVSKYWLAPSVPCSVPLTEYSSTLMVTIPHSQISRRVICDCPWVDWRIQRQQHSYNLLVTSTGSLVKWNQSYKTQLK